MRDQHTQKISRSIIWNIPNNRSRKANFQNFTIFQRKNEFNRCDSFSNPDPQSSSKFRNPKKIKILKIKILKIKISRGQEKSIPQDCLRFSKKSIKKIANFLKKQVLNKPL
jgi:hypothetical protein